MDGRGWHVETEALETGANGVSRSVHDQESFELRGLCGGTELYGHAGVHDALADFCVRWSDGLDLLTEDAREISGTLTRVAQAYRDADEEAARALPDPALDAVDD